MNKKINKDLIVVIYSIFLTLIFILVLNIMLSIGRCLGISILTNSVVVNTLLEVTIFLTQILVLKISCKRKISMEDLGLKVDKNTHKHIFIGFMCAVIFMISVLICLCIIKYLEFEGIGFKIYIIEDVIISIINAFLIAIFAAVCEEVFFRGILCRYLSKFKGSVFGIITSSIIFSVFHAGRTIDIKNFIFIFCCGMVLGYCFDKTKSLHLSMAIHFGIDFVSFLTAIDTTGFLVFKQNVSSAALDNASFIIQMILYFILILMFILLKKVKKISEMRKDKI